MNTILKRMIEANRRYSESGNLTGSFSAERRAETASGQKPYAVVITCSDSRVIPEAVFSAGIGELFVVRTAGNVIGDTELASVEYAVHHLQVKNVIVMGHTGCGAVNAAIIGEFEGAVGAVTKRIKTAIGGVSDPDKACRLNVRYGVDTLKRKLSDPEINVTGAIYDIVSGKVVFEDLAV